MKTLAIALKYLCKYAKENYGMNLLCGERSMNNLVNWVHMLEDPETASFLHGEELIFSTGIGYSNTDWLIGFARKLVENQASGLVLNIGPYIKSVPEELTAYCREAQFPLFTIPWKTRIVDITNDFCRKIIKSEENELTVAGAFRNAIFFPEKMAEFNSVLEHKEFDLTAKFCVAALSLRTPSPDKFIEFDKSVRQYLTKILYNHNDRFNIFRQDKYLIVVLQDFPLEIVENAMMRLYEVFSSAESTAGGSGTAGRSSAEGESAASGMPGTSGISGAYRIYAGISQNDPGITSLPHSYKRAVALLPIAEKQRKSQVSYRSVGLYQLLLEVDDAGLLHKIYEDSLGRLKDYDEKNRTDYLITLKRYLDHNASVQEVALETFVHRNTINYKIKKIKEILQCELNFQDCLRLLLALHIGDLL